MRIEFRNRISGAWSVLKALLVIDDLLVALGVGSRRWCVERVGFWAALARGAHSELSLEWMTTVTYTRTTTPRPHALTAHMHHSNNTAPVHHGACTVHTQHGTYNIRHLQPIHQSNYTAPLQHGAYIAPHTAAPTPLPYTAAFTTPTCTTAPTLRHDRNT